VFAIFAMNAAECHGWWSYVGNHFC